MSYFFHEPDNHPAPTIAGGEASLGAIASASRDALLYVDNSNSWFAAHERAYDERIREIHAATGVQLENPWRRAEIDRLQQRSWSIPNPFAMLQRDTEDERQRISGYENEFADELMHLGEKFPDQREAIGLDRPVRDDALRIARAAEERMGMLFSSRSGIGKWGALLAGGMAGAVNDPVTLLSLVAGGGPGAARTAVGRILTVAGKEMIINAGAEAAIQPNVQAWRREVGLNAGFDEGLRNVLFAGAIGGAFGAAGRGAYEAFSGSLSRNAIDRAAETLAADRRLSPDARAILNNDGLAAAPSLARIRDDLPAEARGALDRAETIRLADDARPAAASRNAHDLNLAAADRMLAQPGLDAWPGFLPDTDQIARVVREIVGETVTETVTPNEGRSLTGFLIDMGGVRDHRGELAAIGGDKVTERFRGRLLNNDGIELDRAREAAAEAGYMDARFGSSDEAMARSTVADLLDLLAEDTGGNPVLRGNDAPLTRGNNDAAVAGVESLISDIARYAGPAVDDAIVARAARLALDDGVDAFDALERVLVREELSSVRGIPNTRGDGQQYHGSTAPIDELLEGAYNDRNIYGQGFYTSDALDIVDGYANRRGATKPTIYSIEEVTPVRFLDMEEPIPDWLLGNPDKLADEWWPQASELIEAALTEQPPNLRAFYDEIRAYSGSYDVSRYDVQEIFDTFAYQIKERGYGGLRHIGGLRTNNEPHNVQIYFDPHEQLRIKEIDSPHRVPVPSTSSDNLLPGWSDEELLAISESRSLTAEPDGIDHPGRILRDDEISMADIEEYRTLLGDDAVFPGDDGTLLPLVRVMEDIETNQHLINVLKACRI